MTLIDTHIHIDFYPNPMEIAHAYESKKIYAMFVTNLPELFIKHRATFSSYKYIRLCLGYHPQVSSEYELDESLFSEAAQYTKYIGEVGLDFSEPLNNREINRQIEAFRFITSEDFNKGRIYTIHSRAAEEEVLEILIKNNVKHAIFHWYTGKISTLNKIVEQGYYFSLNPRMLTSKNGLNIISKIPKELLLFETDGPFGRINRKIITPDQIRNLYGDFNKVIFDFEKIVFTNFRRILIEKDL